MVERRAYVRYAIDGLINLKTEDDVSSGFKIDVTEISFLGVTIYSQERIDIVDKIVQFELMTGVWQRPLIGKGKIKYINEEKKGNATVFRMGLEFIDIDKDNLLHIVNILQETVSSRVKKVQRAQGIPTQPNPSDPY